MKHVADVTLVENSTAGNQPRTFAAQTVEIAHEADTIVTSADGHTSRARHPSKIFWRGGTARDLDNITDVRITDSSGVVLIDGELNTNRHIPRDVPGGVTFNVLKT